MKKKLDMRKKWLYSIDTSFILEIISGGQVAQSFRTK